MVISWGEDIVSALILPHSKTVANVGGEEEGDGGRRGLSGCRKARGLPPPSRLADAVRLCCLSLDTTSSGGRTEDKDELAATILLLCSHSLVSESKIRASQLWQCVTSEVKETVSPSWTTAVGRAVASAAVASRPHSQLTREAAHVAMMLLASSKQPAFVECILHVVLPRLRTQLTGTGIGGEGGDPTALGSSLSILALSEEETDRMLGIKSAAGVFSSLLTYFYCSCSG